MTWEMDTLRLKADTLQEFCTKHWKNPDSESRTLVEEGRDMEFLTLRHSRDRLNGLTLEHVRAGNRCRNRRERGRSHRAILGMIGRSAGRGVMHW